MARQGRGIDPKMLPMPGLVANKIITLVANECDCLMARACTEGGGRLCAGGCTGVEAGGGVDDPGTFDPVAGIRLADAEPVAASISKQARQVNVTASV
jgi:hypothetical protein